MANNTRSRIPILQHGAETSQTENINQNIIHYNNQQIIVEASCSNVEEEDSNVSLKRKRSRSSERDDSDSDNVSNSSKANSGFDSDESDNEDKLSHISSFSNTLYSLKKPVTNTTKNGNKYIHNKIPKFNGSENVLDYIDDAKHFADQHPSLLGKELVNNLKIGITGEARTVLRGYDINDSQKLFKVLKSIFEPKVESIKTALIMKQSTSESVRVFSAKVRDYLSRSGVKDRALDQINLEALLQGLRPEIAKQIPITERRKLSKTLRVAM